MLLTGVEYKQLSATESEGLWFYYAMKLYVSINIHSLMLNFKQLLKLLEFLDLVFICQRNDQTQAQSKSRVFRKKKTPNLNQQPPTFLRLFKKVPKHISTAFETRC